MDKSSLIFKESEILPFPFWRWIYDDVYVYVKAYDVKKEGFLPDGISSHFTKYVKGIIEHEHLNVKLEEVDINLYMYNPDYYEFVDVTAPVYELRNDGFFYLIEDNHTGKVPTSITVREASKLYNNVLKQKIHDAIKKEKQEAFDENFYDASLDGKSAILYGFSAQELMEIDSKKYIVEFLRKDPLGDFEIRVIKR